MIDNELQSTRNFVLYTTPNGEVKLEVVSILETVQKEGASSGATGTTRNIRAVPEISIKHAPIGKTFGVMQILPGTTCGAYQNDIPSRH